MPGKAAKWSSKNRGLDKPQNSIPMTPRAAPSDHTSTPVAPDLACSIPLRHLGRWRYPAPFCVALDAYGGSGADSNSSADAASAIASACVYLDFEALVAAGVWEKRPQERTTPIPLSRFGDKKVHTVMMCCRIMAAEYVARDAMDLTDLPQSMLPDDEAAYRREFGEPASSGIDFGKYADIPVEMELPRNMSELPAEMASCKTFLELKCGRVLGRNLRLAGFSVPTPVQGHSVPMAINGLDVISVAQTGSGKTLAFMLPIMYKLLEAGPGGGNFGGGRNTVVAIRALAMAPTRELAVQIQEESKKFAFRTGLRICVAYGGAPFGDQMRGTHRPQAERGLV